MNTLDRFLQLAFTQLGQSTLVSVAALVVAWGLRNRSPHLAYAVLILALAKFLTPPIVHSPLSVYDNLLPQAGSKSVVRSLIDAKLPVDPSAVDSSFSTDLAVDDSPYRFAERTKDSGELRAFPFVGALVLAVWLTGSLMVFLCVVRKWRLEISRIEGNSHNADRPLMALYRELARKLGITKNVRLLVCDDDMGPLSFGIIQPTIVLPRSIVDRDSAIRPILAHELLHIRRRDPLTAALQIVATTVWWFHPISWILSSEITRLRERCCDDETLATDSCNSAAYADAILDVVRLKHRLQGASLAVGLKPVELTRERLESIMNSERKRHCKTPWTVWFAFCVGLFFILPGAYAESPADDSNSSAGVSAEAGSFPDFLVYKVRTELQRRICRRHFDIEDPTVVVLANGEAILEKAGDRWALSDSFKDELAVVISEHQDLTPEDKSGGIVIRMLLASPTSLDALTNRLTTKEAKDELETLGRALGFKESHAGLRYYAQSDAQVNVYSQWVCEPIMKGSDHPDVQEPKVGDNRIAVYPVRTKLSRGLTGGADCVIEYYTPIDSKTQTLISKHVKEFVSACVKRAEISETDKRIGTVIHLASNTFDSSKNRMERQFQISDELREFHRTLGLHPFGTLTHAHN